MVQLTLLTCSLTLVASCANEQVISDQEAKKKAIATAKALKVPIVPAEVFVRSDRGVSVRVGEYTFLFIGADGTLRSINNRSSNALSSASRPLRTPEDAWKAGDRVIKALNLPDYPRHEFGARPGWKNVNPNLRYCTYKVVVDGYPSDDFGNCISMTFDTNTGHLGSLHIGAGYSYNRPKSKITGDRAVELARSQAGGSRSLLKKPLLTYALADQDVSNVAAQRVRNKQMRLVYRVVLKGVTVDVDAETGDILMVGYHKG